MPVLFIKLFSCLLLNVILSFQENAFKGNKAFGAEIVLNVQVMFCWQYPLCHWLITLLSF